MFSPQFHLISNGKQTLDEFARIASLVNPYVTSFHLREKQLTAKEIAIGVRSMLEAGIPADKIIINDRADVAYVFQTSGVQLAYHSLEPWQVKHSFPSLQVGCSVHSREEAEQKQQEGADFLLFGHVYQTASKPGLEPRGLITLQKVTARVSIPVIAIGGIKPQHVQQIMGAGAAGIAVMSSILEADNPKEMAQVYHERLHTKE
jgi:thiazole tautomerase (transcriptional regulator TenI)